MIVNTDFVGALAVGALVAATLWLVPSSTLAQEAETPAGQSLFVDTYKCNTCHSVAAAGIEHKVERTAGPDLGGFTTDDFAAIASFVRKEAQRDGEDHKKTYDGTDEELHQILDWLCTLEPAE
jgi:mono/diheme cytochrome c family protein